MHSSFFSSKINKTDLFVRKRSDYQSDMDPEWLSNIPNAVPECSTGVFHHINSPANKQPLWFLADSTHVLSPHTSRPLLLPLPLLPLPSPCALRDSFLRHFHTFSINLFLNLAPNQPQPPFPCFYLSNLHIHHACLTFSWHLPEAPMYPVTLHFLYFPSLRCGSVGFEPRSIFFNVFFSTAHIFHVKW